MSPGHLRADLTAPGELDGPLAAIDFAPRNNKSGCVPTTDLDTCHGHRVWSSVRGMAL